MKIHFVLENICPRRLLDIQKIRQYFLMNDCRMVNTRDEADCVLLFGCALDHERDNFSFLKAEELSAYCKSRHKDLIILEGIVDTRGKELVSKGIIKEEKAIKNGEYYKLNNLFPFKHKLEDTKESSEFYGEGDICSLFKSDSRKYYVQICHGCNNNCAYCSEKIIVKDLKSKPIDKIVEEIRLGLALGHKHIILLGDDATAYGIDLGCSIVDLLKEVAGIDGVFDVTMWEVNLNHIIEHLNDFDNILGRIRINLPAIGIQSGNNRILRLMNRGYTKQAAEKAFRLLEKHKVYMGFHIILGFPTETFSEFQETIRLISKYDFNEGLIFAYCDKAYAPSSKIFPKVDTIEIKRRMNAARRFFSKHGFRYESRLGYLYVFKNEKIAHNDLTQSPGKMFYILKKGLKNSLLLAPFLRARRPL